MSRAGVLHHDGCVKEIAFSLGLWTLRWWLPTEGPSTTWVRRGSGASRGSAPQSRSGRGEGRWPGRGGCGGSGGGVGAAGRGGRRLPPVLRLWASLRPCSDKFQLFDLKVPQIQFIDRVLACSCASETCTHSANCAADRWNSPGAVLGAGSWHARCLQRQVPAVSSSVTVEVPRFSSSTKWVLRCGQTQVLWDWRFHWCSSRTRCSATAGIGTSTRPSMCQWWEHWILLDISIDSGIQFGRANAVFAFSSSPLDDDDEGFGDDDLLECGAADEESKIGRGLRSGFWRFFRIFRAPPNRLELSAIFRSPRWRRVLCHRGLLHNFTSELVDTDIVPGSKTSTRASRGLRTRLQNTRGS